MRFFLRIMLAMAAMIVVLPLLLFAGYDLFSFQARRTEISSLIEKANPDERSPSSLLINLVRASTGNHASAQASRMLVYELHLRNEGGTMRRQFTEMLWWALVAMHLSEQEQVSIIASCSYMGSARRGFSAEAMVRFHRPLAELSASETATLVALSHAPELYSNSPERLTRRRDWLLNKLPKDNS